MDEIKKPFEEIKSGDQIWNFDTVDAKQNEQDGVYYEVVHTQYDSTIVDAVICDIIKDGTDEKIGRRTISKKEYERTNLRAL